MVGDYVSNYFKAIENPLSNLNETFEEEIELLKSFVNKNSIVLDVGCGAGRPADKLSDFVKEIVCIDNDSKMIALAEERCKNFENIKIVNDNAFKMKIKDNTFDFVYATYNLIGSIEEFERQKLVDEMVRVAKKGTKVVNITWKDDVFTTNFLGKYYPSIGIDIFNQDEAKTVTSIGTLDRISKERLLEYYESANLKEIKFIGVGPVWVAIVGIKI